MKEIEEKSLQDVVAVMPEGNLGGLQFGGQPIENPASKPLTERTGGLSFGNHALDDAVGVLPFDMKIKAPRP